MAVHRLVHLQTCAVRFPLPEVVIAKTVPSPFNAPAFRRAVERAVDIEEGRRIRARAVRFTCEAIEHGFRAGRRDLEHGSAIAGRPPSRVVP